MGTKRIGLARIEALVENLKRDISLDGATLSGAITIAGSKVSDNYEPKKGWDRYHLEEWFEKTPGLNADLASTTEATNEPRNKNFECTKSITSDKVILNNQAGEKQVCGAQKIQ